MKKCRCFRLRIFNQGYKPPSHCPICGVQTNMFEEIEDPKDNDGKKA